MPAACIRSRVLRVEGKVKELLLSLGIIDEKNIELFSVGTRDSNELKVWRDKVTGVIFFNDASHIPLGYYEIDRLPFHNTVNEAQRRFAQFFPYLNCKFVLDIGVGDGAFVKTAFTAAHITGVDPKGGGFYRSIKDISVARFDTVTMFHVFEHLADPMDMLAEIKRILKPNGTLIIEVPHARDVLFNLDCFKKFSMWGEHLILHTRQSMAIMLEKAGFQNIKVEPYQRYGLHNHIGWMVHGQGNGSMDRVPWYDDELKATDQTDTLIAVATWAS